MFVFSRQKRHLHTVASFSPFVEIGSMEFFKNETFIDNFHPICNMNVKQIEKHGKNVE